MSALAAWPQRLATLAPVTQAALWMLLGGVASVAMNAVIRVAATELHPFEVTFFRCLFALVLLLPWLRRAGGLAVLRTSHLRLFLFRGTVAFLSMLGWFWGITQVPFATATALNFTAPLFSTVLAALVLHETVRARRWSAVIVGFLGVLVVVRPGVAAAADPGALAILASAALAAMGSISVRVLVRTESAVAIVAYMLVVLVPLSAVPALLVWRWPSLEVVAWLLVLGGLGNLVHFSIARALALAEASAVAPFEFVKLPMAAVIGWVCFGETTDALTWAGAGIIIASSAYVAHREAKRRGETAAAGSQSTRPLA